MTRPDEIAALADEIKLYRAERPGVFVYSGPMVANILQHWTDRLSATSPGDAVRVLPDWMSSLPMQQQSVLVLALRGPDGIRKHHPCKDMVRFYRGTVLKAARFGRVLGIDEKADTFMSMDGFTDNEIFNARVKAYFDTIDELPHHYHMHLMHGAQILGYKHPDPEYRSRWNHFYLKCLDDCHTPHPETEQEMDERLGDWGRASWDAALATAEKVEDDVHPSHDVRGIQGSIFCTVCNGVDAELVTPCAANVLKRIDVSDFSAGNICKALATSESVPAWIRTLASAATPTPPSGDVAMDVFEVAYALDMRRSGGTEPFRARQAGLKAVLALIGGRA